MEIKNYWKEAFIFDLKAGFITAVVALPLAIAFAIASGVSPIMGLYTAVIAGILGSAFGGSVFSITGPTGAMAVVILSTMSKFGIEGLLLAGFLAGLFQIIFGLIKLGKLVKYMPLPIIAGFTAGIGVLIFIGQIPNALGLIIPSQEHAWMTLWEVIKSISNVSIIAIAITLFTVIVLMFYPKITSKNRLLRSIPPSIIVLIAVTSATYLYALNIPQVGDIPSGLPQFSFFKFNFDLLKAVLPAALTIALLGAIESLLCAVVSDGMTNTKHDSDRELIAQGVTNSVLPFFGGIPATAAVARTAVNIREGAKTRYAGIIHAIIILIIIMFFAPVAKFIPKAFLAGVLMYVSARMINVHEFKTIIEISRAEATVLFLTFGLTVFTDLVFAVEAGMVFAIFLIFIKLTNIINISPMEDYDAQNGINHCINCNPKLKEKVAVYTIHGPFFFGAMSVFESKINEHMNVKRDSIIIRMKHVPFVDSTAIVRINNFLKGRSKQKKEVFFSGIRPNVLKTLMHNHEFAELVNKDHIFNRTHEALDYIEKHVA